MSRTRIIQVCLVLGCLLQAPAVLAQADANLQVLARTLGFMDPPMKGRLRVGILYDPASTAATRDANALSGQFAGGLRSGGLVLEARLVPIAEAAKADVDLFLLSRGNGERAAAVAPVLKARKLPCLSTDLDQVRAGHCTIGLQSAPRVEIILNTSLAADSDTAFASVFRMMIKEL